jgi:myo-inositol 2-dehydrogenase / D-chiro-inositol 1-dehydrogenase
VPDQENPNSNRRSFLRGATSGLLLVSPRVAFGSQANSNVEFGLIGCGNRGSWIAPLFIEHTGAKLVAAADVVRANLDGLRDKYSVGANRAYYGPDAYRELAESKVDAVVIETPPYYHPLHARAAVAAGKHVYLAKPVAVDVPGCKEVIEAGRTAAAKGRSFWVDFQMRAQESFQEATARVHRGDIGSPVFGQSYFHGARSGLTKNYEGLDPELIRLKNFYSDLVLGGDILVEQGIHVVDGMNWFMQGHPVKAFGTGGLGNWRGTPQDRGNSGWDHYAVTYWYPNGAHVLCSEVQLGKSTGGIVTNCFGIHGTLETRYNGMVRIYGTKAWPGVEKDATMNQGTANNIKTFIRSIRDSKPVNNAPIAVESTLSAILGREAALKEAIITWDELLKSEARKEVKLKLRY